MFEKRPLNKFSGEAEREDSEAIFEKRVAAIVSVSQAAWVGWGWGGGGMKCGVAAAMLASGRRGPTRMSRI